MMKIVKMFAVATIIGMVLFAYCISSHSTAAQNLPGKEITTQITIVSDSTVECRFIRIGEGEAAKYVVMGKIAQRMKSFDARKMALCSPTDSMCCVGILVNKTQWSELGWNKELFAFMVSGPAFKKRISQPGPSVLVFFGATQQLFIRVDTDVEDTIKQAITCVPTKPKNEV